MLAFDHPLTRLYKGQHDNWDITFLLLFKEVILLLLGLDLA